MGKRQAYISLEAAGRHLDLARRALRSAAKNLPDLTDEFKEAEAGSFDAVLDWMSVTVIRCQGDLERQGFDRASRNGGPA